MRASICPISKSRCWSVQAALKRASAEAAEGLASFRDQRDPDWYAPARDGTPP